MKSSLKIGLLSLLILMAGSCNPVRVFLEKEQIPKTVGYKTFAIENEFPGKNVYGSPDLDITLQQELIAGMEKRGFELDINNPDIVLRYNTILSQNQKEINPSSNNLWGYGMYNPYMRRYPYPYDYELTEGSITEIPITIVPTKFPLNVNWHLARYYFQNVNSNLLLRTFRKFFFTNQPVWARPAPNVNISIFKKFLDEIIRRDLPFITMMFHSSELMPGCSKYRPDKDSIEELYKLLEEFFELLQQNQIGSVTLTKAAQIYKT